VPDELVAVRTAESFDSRGAQRIGDATVAVVSGEVAGVGVTGTVLCHRYTKRR
jgi:hypothetical protein